MSAPVHVQLLELDLCEGLLPRLVLLHGVELNRVVEQIEVVPQALQELRERYPADAHLALTICCALVACTAAFAIYIFTSGYGAAEHR